jgi:hypothetical protein
LILMARTPARGACCLSRSLWYPLGHVSPAPSPFALIACSAESIFDVGRTAFAARTPSANKCSRLATGKLIVRSSLSHSDSTLSPRLRMSVTASRTRTTSVEPLRTLSLRAPASMVEPAVAQPNYEDATYKYIRFLPFFDQTLRLQPLVPFEYIDTGAFGGFRRCHHQPHR